MPNSALPERLQDPANWKGTDDDNWLMRWRLSRKGWFAYGPRATQWWAQWREWPIMLFKRGPGILWRYEDDETSWIGCNHQNVGDGLYISRIQYWKRWHFQIQWPLMIAGHFYFSQKNVPLYPTRPGDTTKNKLFYFYIGCMRDADKVYWFPSFYAGLTWK
jgi:hypothetical protein